jgi:hypothetical protein
VYSKRCIAFFCVLCSTALLTGCVAQPMPTTDRLPSGIPKGYVVFYRGDLSGSGIQRSAIVIHQLQDEEETHMGKRSSQLIPIVLTQSSMQRIACRPGQHTFVARLGNAIERIQVDVKQNKITPVKVTITPGLTTEVYSEKYSTTTFEFKMSLEVEEVLPIE